MAVVEVVLPENFSKEDIREYLDELNSMVGLDNVKKELNEFVDELVAKLIEADGKPVELGWLNMAFKGKSGLGKTTVAHLLGKIYTKLGILKQDDVFINCSRYDLVSPYQGVSMTKVKSAFEAAKDGILFIDQAYALGNDDSDGLGREAIQEILVHIESSAHNVVVIFAGNNNDMDIFFEKFPSLKNRLAKELSFE